jgi:predicted porin
MGTRGALAANQWNNAIYYTTPTISGFNAGVIWQSDEDKVNATTGATTKVDSGAGFHLAYLNGPFSMAASYQREQDKWVTTGADSMDTTAFGTYYDFGVAKVMMTYARSTNANITNTGSQTVFTMGARVPMGPGELRASYRKMNDTAHTSKTDASGDQDSTRYSVGYAYFLSKLTSINLSLVRENQVRYNTNGTTKTDLSGTGYEVALRKMF